jgi:uncharacterized protein YggE
MIQTVSYNVYQTSSCANFTYYPPIYPTTTIYCPSPRRFFIASEYLLLTIPNVTDTNAALVGLSGISGVSIGNVAARLSQQQQANMSEEALSLALSNATGQAQALAGGRQLQVRNITVQSNYLFYAGASVAAAPAPSYNQTFYPGRATVTKSIYVVFSMH